MKICIKCSVCSKRLSKKERFRYLKSEDDEPVCSFCKYNEVEDENIDNRA